MRVGIFPDTHDHLAHIRQLRGLDTEYDIAVFGHTHKPRIECDERGRLQINPRETSG